MKTRHVTEGGLPFVLMDSISYIGAEDAGCIIVSGSHGGSAAGTYALEVSIAAAFFNDAGVGKENAGIVALAMLAAQAVPAAAVAHTSARIGDAADTWANGVISYVNDPAAMLGIHPGMSVRDAARLCRIPVSPSRLLNSES
jgi:hypothetical protein